MDQLLYIITNLSQQTHFTDEDPAEFKKKKTLNKASGTVTAEARI